MNPAVVPLQIPDDANLVFGQSHFIKTADKLRFTRNIAHASRFAGIQQVHGNDLGHSPTSSEVAIETKSQLCISF